MIHQPFSEPSQCNQLTKFLIENRMLRMNETWSHGPMLGPKPDITSSNSVAAA